jgi:hypothetical protein
MGLVPGGAVCSKSIIRKVKTVYIFDVAKLRSAIVVGRIDHRGEIFCPNHPLSNEKGGQKPALSRLHR